MCGKKSKILFLNHWGKYPGGAEYSLIDILKETVKDYQTHLITTENGFLQSKSSEMGVHCHIVPCTEKLSSIKRDSLFKSLIRNAPALFQFILFSFRVRSLVKTLAPSCIHANVPKSHVLLLLLRLYGFRGRAVFHIREIFPDKSFSRWVYNLLLCGSVEVIAISSAVKDSLPQRLRPKTRIIHNGVTIRGPAKRGAYSGAVSFVYVGRIVPWKGCHHLIEAFSMLKKRTSRKTTLTLIGSSFYGDDAYREKLSAEIKEKGLTDSAFLRPHTEDPWKKIPRNAVFCTASADEPFGRSVAEAQGAGLPVIAFCSGGISEIVKHGVSGLLVTQSDIMALSNAMETLLESSDLLNSMGKAGCKRAGKLFNREIQIKKVKDAIIGSVPQGNGFDASPSKH
ncbi:Glycosyl transferase [Chitinispirillum alkaliphilum]|nr:Glycosyl transferase [Chitinispirillum alkaliphilum]